MRPVRLCFGNRPAKKPAHVGLNSNMKKHSLNIPANMHSNSKNPPRRTSASLTLFSVCLCLLLGACGDPIWLPRAHKIEVQQGNLLTEEQIESIEAGMSREEVAALIGVPVNQPAFQPDRWDYVFTRSPAGQTVAARRFSVFFDEGDRVANIEANFDRESGEIIMPKFWFSRPDRPKPVPAKSTAGA